MTYIIVQAGSQLRNTLKLISGLSLLLSIAIIQPASAAPMTNNVKPSINAVFTSQMNDVWNAISTDSTNEALKNFFPSAAYIQMKQGVLPNPAADFSARLLGFFKLDLFAYHQLVISGGPSKFTAVRVNPAQISWISPGVCENKIGYWHLGPVRIIYEQGGVTKSFAIASLISWNGVWKIIHLGPNPRAKNIGTVDSPALGPGIAGPGGGC